MKTRFGSAIATASGDFRNDTAKVVAETTPEILSRLVDYFVDARLANTRQESQDIIANARIRFPDLSSEVFDSSLKIVAIFFSVLKPEDELPSILEDLKQLQVINDNNRAHVEALLSNIFTIYKQRYRRDTRIKTTRQNIIPTLDSIDWEIDFRSVLENPLSIHNLAETFHPKILGFTPVAVVKISLENDKEEPFCFQLDEKTFSILKNQILGMEKHFEAAKKSFSTEREIL